MASSTLRKILARKEFRVTEAEWLQLDEDERDAIKEFRQQAKIVEQTRGERITNDRKEAVSVDIADLAERVTALQNKVNEIMEYQLGDALPAKIYQVEELSEVVSTCRETLKTIKLEFAKIWDKLRNPGTS